MAISKQETQKRFNHSYEDVFKGFCDVIPRIGFKLISNDKTNGEIFHYYHGGKILLSI